MSKHSLLKTIVLGISIGLVVTVFEADSTVTISMLEVVYPKQNQTIGAVDSTFVFGQMGPFRNSDNYLTINDSRVPIHKDGGWLAFLPLEPGEFDLIFKLYSSEDHLLVFDTITVNVPEPLESISTDSLVIAGEYKRPPGDMYLTSGESIEFSFRGTPGLKAYASIEGLNDSIPMAEGSPRLQPYWGERVFGQGLVPDSMKISGIYTGQLLIPQGVNVEKQNIVYHLGRPDIAALAIEAMRHPTLDNYLKFLNYFDAPEIVTYESDWELTTNSPAFPFTIRFSDSMQIIRHEPRMGYFATFQPAGVEALVVGQAGGWYRMQLSETQFAYADSSKVERLPQGINQPKSYLSVVRTYSYDDSLVIELPLSGKHCFQVVESSKRQIKLRLFGVISDTDWIRYDGKDKLVDRIIWSQPEPELYELTIDLKADIWGYETHYVGSSFYLSLNRAPEETWRLKGKRIVIDPGHSADAGAVGPTGLSERVANLSLGLMLERLLKRAGAEVIMTRTDMSHVELYGRPAIAKANDADLFVSIHNNALPDGVNPFKNNGVSTYYYNAHSIELARAIQSELVDATGLRDHGLYYGNLAVNRPTQYPAVLVECAFMMIPEQEAALKTYKYQKKVAGAIMRGIESFLENYQSDENE